MSLFSQSQYFCLILMYVSIFSSHKNSSYGKIALYYFTIGGTFFQCPFLTDLFTGIVGNIF